ncbi:hypothetical protein BDY21DRAFT_342712 [Lineolata rhizophorae]|uniref:DUF7918 domain-containing protein n=1 Tax=Lineolata rhizophorae TaxID=578093 RepID=A0A6A6P155_9PEZI|nr:hypothetical protein BDY21DRAFT_342712 [Lineolata rhizophorae]
MPCFHGLAVSIHSPEGPLSEYSIQRQSKFHRITSYIPVPPPKISATGRPEQSTFAISITLLTPGLPVPYSTPKPTPEDPNPRPKIVGGLPSLPASPADRGKYGGVIAPYQPLTASPNETIAAYIYFDGRAKEEVATLLRRGEETWVNSRWVSVPESEGGGLAEREFLFREVGLERWLNGLDLEGKEKDVAARIERRRQRLERRRRRKEEELRIKKEEMAGQSDSDEDMGASGAGGSTLGRRAYDRNGVLRYGDNKDAPVESLSGTDSLFSSDSDSDDEPPMPEAAGQIKVALFRVLASGEIKRGEYSPQFDAHDDDDAASNQNGSSNENGNSGDVDHTTSFAKPKTLDPKSISTQTVTGIDPPEKPYAVFTFLYRGERQLQKMGILPPPRGAQASKTPGSASKRKSSNIDFGNLKPLDASHGTRNFVGYRDSSARKSPASKNSNPFANKSGGPADDDAMDSDADDEENSRKGKNEDDDVEELDIKEGGSGALLSPEDAAKEGELAEEVRKVRLKRQHSAEPIAPPTATTASRTTPPFTTTNGTDPLLPTSTSADLASATALGRSTSVDTGAATATTASSTGTAASSGGPSSTTAAAAAEPLEGIIGSPFKKQRASLPAFDDDVRRGLSQKLVDAVMGAGASGTGTSAGGMMAGGKAGDGVDGGPLTGANRVRGEGEGRLERVQSAEEGAGVGVGVGLGGDGKEAGGMMEEEL